jgi:hypothetical protein
MNKSLPHLVWLIGLFIVFIGIVVGPGVPYQDPTPEMRALEARQMQRSERIALAGLCLFAGGIVWSGSHWLIRRLRNR